MSNTTQQLNLLKAQLEASLTPSQIEARSSFKSLNKNARDTKDRNNAAKVNAKAAKTALDLAKQEAKEAKEALAAAQEALAAAQASVESTYTVEQNNLKNQISEVQKAIMTARLASKK